MSLDVLGVLSIFYQNGSIDTGFDPPLFSLDSTFKRFFYIMQIFAKNNFNRIAGVEVSFLKSADKGSHNSDNWRKA